MRSKNLLEKIVEELKRRKKYVGTIGTFACWLASRGLVASKSAGIDALNRAVEKGLVVKTKLPDGKVELAVAS